MPRLNDLSNKTFGRLTVLSRAGVAKNGKAKWCCLCVCGEKSVAVGSELLTGHTTSCGCWRNERNASTPQKHGHSTHRNGDSATYRTWLAMRTRCLNQNVKSFADYGAKGVKVDPAWDRFEQFLADMGERPEGKTLDRWPNTRGNYEPGNCRWATKIEQARNTTANVLVTFEGETLTQVEWALRKGISQATLSYRLRNGWSPLEALSIKPRLGSKRTPALRAGIGEFASKLGETVELP